MKKMIRFGLLAGVTAVLAAATSCGKDSTDSGLQPGVTQKNWNATEHVARAGADLEFAFTAAAAWTAASDSPSWCVVRTESGPKGRNTLRIGIGANDTGAVRAAEITVSAAGYAPATFSVSQTDEQGTDAGLNEWMAAYMKTHYLWNEPVKSLRFDYSLGYEDFLEKVLLDVAARNDVNHDDGHWENGKRLYFYSNIQRFPASAVSTLTRGTRPEATGFGIDYLVVDNFMNSNKKFFVLAAVAPGSPAAALGLERGDYILEVDGQAITASNVEHTWNTLMSYTAATSVTITPGIVGQQGVGPGDPVTLNAGTYDDNPVWVSRVIDAGSDRKVGYLCYAAFNNNYDRELIDAISGFKSAAVTDVVLDLRYNTGGHVVSSLALGTLIAGPDYTGKVYSHTTYNADRTAAGAVYDWKIGRGDQSVVAALSHAVGLKTVYVLCTNNTASSSELVINGLRGLGIGVRLIGQRTNGKNVGMEPVTRTEGGYEYEFAPITFYSENAEGYRDYGNGFPPDVAINEWAYETCAWGDERDPLLAAALEWIRTGSKPAAPAVSKTRGGLGEIRITAPEKPFGGMIIDRVPGRE